jgi:hypothetical protein
MQEFKLILLGVACLLYFGNGYSARAQSLDKRELIIEFRTLTGAHKVDGSVNFNTASLRAVLWSVVAEDKDLNDAQKQNLAKYVDDATARVEKKLREFLNDQTQMAKLSEEVIFRIYDSTFNENELKEIIAFYRTSTGRKANEFLRGLSSRVQAEMAPLLQKEVQRILDPNLEAAKDELREQIKAVKKSPS